MAKPGGSLCTVRHRALQLSDWPFAEQGNAWCLPLSDGLWSVRSTRSGSGMDHLEKNQEPPKLALDNFGGRRLTGCQQTEFMFMNYSLRIWGARIQGGLHIFSYAKNIVL